MPDISIRPAQTSDIEAVNQLLVETWQATYANIYEPEKITELTGRWHSPEVLTSELNNSTVCFLVADLNGEIAGHLLGQEEENNVILLRRLYVLPKAQGRGLGTKLFLEMLDQYPAAKFVRLEVEPQNVQALQFYQRAGFFEVGKTGNCGGDSDIPAVIMEKPL